MIFSILSGEGGDFKILKKSQKMILLNKSPVLWAFQKNTDSLKMKAMSSSMGFKMSDERMPDKGKIADEIQNFMADKLIGEAEGAVDDPLLIQDQSILEGSPEG